MGVKGLWELLKPSKQQQKLADIVTQHGVQDDVGVKGFVLGIDASIWIHALLQANTRSATMNGPSPALLTVFYRLARLARRLITAVVVFDGDMRPGEKRGKKVVSREYFLIKHLQAFIKTFGFYVHTAPGEAEAELAAMNRSGAVDAVLTDDSDALMFGAHTVIRNPNIKIDKENVRVYTAQAIANHSATMLQPHDLVLIATLSGGDYSPGLPNCGPQIAHALTRYGLGASLVDACHLTGPGQAAVLSAWRDDLQNLLEDDPDGHLGRRHRTLAASIPGTFPDPDVVLLYSDPLVSPAPHAATTYAFDSNPPHIDLPELTRLCERHFGWDENKIVDVFTRNIWPAIALRAAVSFLNPEWQKDPTTGESDQLPTVSILPTTSRRDQDRDERKLVLDTAPLVSTVTRALVYPSSTGSSKGPVGERLTVRIPGYIVREMERRSYSAPAIATPTRLERIMQEWEPPIGQVSGSSSLLGLAAGDLEPVFASGSGTDTSAALAGSETPAHRTTSEPAIDLSDSPLVVPESILGEIIDLTDL